MRIPPGLPSKKCVEILEEKLTAQGDDTFGARIEFECLDAGDGFDAPDLPAKLKQCLNEATAEIFANKPPLYVGCGGSIPFMDVFAQEFPGYNFLLTELLAKLVKPAALATHAGLIVVEPSSTTTLRTNVVLRLSRHNEAIITNACKFLALTQLLARKTSTHEGVIELR